MLEPLGPLLNLILLLQHLYAFLEISFHTFDLFYGHVEVVFHFLKNFVEPRSQHLHLRCVQLDDFKLRLKAIHSLVDNFKVCPLFSEQSVKVINGPLQLLNTARLIALFVLVVRLMHRDYLTSRFNWNLLRIVAILSDLSGLG